jgi:hypothetical protein
MKASEDLRSPLLEFVDIHFPNKARPEGLRALPLYSTRMTGPILRGYARLQCPVWCGSGHRGVARIARREKRVLPVKKRSSDRDARA